MASSPTMIDMPADIMEMVLKDVDFQDLQALRKVSRDLRNYIDDAVPISNLLDIEIEAKPNRIRFEIETFGKVVEIVYKNHKDGCLVVCGKKKKLLENEDFVIISGKDLHSILRHHKSTMDSCLLCFSLSDSERMLPTSAEFLENFQSYLKSRDQPLQIKDFTFEKTYQRQIMMVLPYIDSKRLEEINFINNQRKRRKSRTLKIDKIGTLETDEIIMLDQWKNAKILKISKFIIPTPVASFAHFKYAQVSVDTISLEDMIEWRKILLQNKSSEFHCLYINYKHFTNEIQFMESFGQMCFPFPGDNPAWFFRIPQSDHVLTITMNDGITFCYDPLNDIPERFLTDL